VDQPSSPTGQRDLRVLAIAPLLVAASIIGVAVSNALVTVGPFDRAQIGWGVGVPLFLLAPGAAAHAGRYAGGREAAWAVGLISVILGVLPIVGLMTIATPSIGCAPASGPLEVLVHAIPVGISTGLAFAGPAGAAWLVRRRGAVVSLAVGAILAFAAIIVTIVVFAVSFVVGVSCAYVPG
jgi:hypothetical protein